MGKISNTVLTSRDQGLTKVQQKNARENIDAMARLSKWSLGDVVISGEGGEVKDSGIKLSPDGKIFAQSDWEETDPENPAYIINKPDLSLKADKTYVDAELNKKAEKTYVDTELNKKADKTYVNAELANKADKTYVDTELAKKAEKTYVDAELANKADKTYVDTELAKKADKTYVDAELIKKADKTYVDSELAKKADKVYVDTELSGKVDKVEGKGLSSNDYTDADKEKLTTLVVREAAEGGTDVSLVTTGEKFTWDAKQDSIEYYLADASISGDGSLVITKKDGSTVIFTGNENAAIDHVATIDGNLPIIDKIVTIPLAEAVVAGEPGNAGLVKGVYENF